jgi:D-sedoheptulose 7-phosphate isomerase
VFVERSDARQLHGYLFAPCDQEGDDRHLLDGVEASTRQKGQDVCELREALRLSCDEMLADAGLALGARLAAGGKLLAFGNGGSATDAQDAVIDCMAPPVTGWHAFPALALPNDVGVVTAIGNDVGFEHVFARQVMAFGRPGDVALGFSTSGASPNVVAALKEAKARGLLTMAMSGGHGGALGRAAFVDFCFTPPSEYLPRIQEAHATAWHALLSVAQTGRIA